MWWLMLMWWLRSMVVVVWHFRPGATWRNVSDTSLPLSKSGLLLVLDLQWHKFCNYFKITVARLCNDGTVTQLAQLGTVALYWHSGGTNCKYFQITCLVLCPPLAKWLICNDLSVNMVLPY